MTRSALLLFLFCCNILLCQEVHPGFRDGRLYVKLSPGTDPAILKTDPRKMPVEGIPALLPFIATYGITDITRPFYAASDDPGLPFVLSIGFTQITKTTEFIEVLEKTKGIEYAEKVPLHVTFATPNDFALSTASVHLTQINAQQAWDIFSGSSNIRVAIVDNAVMWTHADLVANTYTNTGEIPGNSIDDDGNGFVDDVNGFDVADWDNDATPTSTNTSMDHGTLCAGIACARTNNNTGVASIGWNLQLIPVKSEPDGGSSVTVSYGYEGIIYATRAKAHIISCSWGSSFTALTEQAVIDYAWNRGCIIIAAAGNFGSSSPAYPAAYNHVYSVAGVDASDEKIGFSNFGSSVDISAPGWTIYSTVPYNTTPAYGSGSGTSMSAPMVAGLAGLMLSRSPQMTRNDILNCISATAADIYTVPANASYTGQLGAGRIDAFAAMSCAAGYSVLPPVANFNANALHTCPGTPVQFNDSSLYLPTAWSWTFQGGSPATSTLQHPVVQWAGTGTYSVGLTATNANGGDTKIKNSYVHVAGPVAPPFFEGFEQSTFLPAGWSSKNIMNDQMYWERAAGIGGFGTSTASAMFDNYFYSAESERDEMLSPKFSFTSVTQARLVFDVAYARYDQTYSDTLEVKLSTDCGVSWTSIYLRGGTNLATTVDHWTYFVPGATEWRKDTIDISLLAAGQGNVMFSFVNRGFYGQPIYLDNINLYFPTPTLSVTHATATCAGGSISFSNTSVAVGSHTWSAPGGTPFISATTNPTITFNTAGVFSITLNAVNGTTMASLTKTVEVFPYPVTTVSSGSVCSGQTISLSAGGASTYSWSNGAATQTISLSPPANTLITVTGINGGICSSTAIANVSVEITPTVAVSDQTVCPGGTAIMTASGASTYSWQNGPATATMAVTPAASGVFTVTGFQNSCSDTKTVSLTLSPPLPLNVSASHTSVCSGQQVTLSANGAGSYSWSTGATGAFLLVSPTITTIYTATGSAGSCTGAAGNTIVVEITPSLVISVDPQGPLCTNQPFTLSVAGAGNYQWSHGPTTGVTIFTPVFNLPHSFTVVGSNGGCSTSTATLVSVNGDTLGIPVSPSLSTICAGKQVTLTASGVTTYSWNGSSSPAQVTVAPAQTATFYVSGSAGNCPATGSAVVNVNSLPIVVPAAIANACADACSGIIDAQITGGSAPYMVSSVGTTCTALPCTGLCAGLYTISVIDANTCVNTATVQVSKSAPLSVSVSGTTACAGCSNGVLSASVSGGIPPVTYSWSNGTAGPLNKNLSPGCYTVLVMDAGQCTVQKVQCLDDVTGIRENPKENFRLYPNPAGSVFTVETDGEAFDLQIFNSLSQLVYNSRKVTKSHTVITSHLAKGAYLIVLSRGQQFWYRKLLLQ